MTGLLAVELIAACAWLLTWVTRAIVTEPAPPPRPRPALPPLRVVLPCLVTTIHGDPIPPYSGYPEPDSGLHRAVTGYRVPREHS